MIELVATLGGLALIVLAAAWMLSVVEDRAVEKHRREEADAALEKKRKEAEIHSQPPRSKSDALNRLRPPNER